MADFKGEDQRLCALKKHQFFTNQKVAFIAVFIITAVDVLEFNISTFKSKYSLGYEEL